MPKSKKNEADPFSLETDRVALLRAVTRANAVIERRNTIPILSNVKLVVSEGMAHAEGTNLDQHLSAAFEAVGDGVTCLPAARLRDVLRAMDGERVAMTGDADGAVNLTCGRTTAKFHTLPASDVPDAIAGSQVWSLTLPEGVFRYLIGGVALAMSTEETRYYLNGVCLEIKDNVATATATDGHRLLSRTANLHGAPDVSSIIIPRDAVKVALAQFGDGEVSLAGEAKAEGKPVYLRLDAPGLSLSTKLIDGKFPDWRRVVPGDRKTRLSFDLTDLRGALKIALANSAERGRAVKIAPEDGGIRFTSRNPDTGDVSTLVPAEIVGEPLQFGVNTIYLDGMAEALERIGTKSVHLELTDAGAPIKVMPDAALAGTLSIIMPMRV